MSAVETTVPKLAPISELPDTFTTDGSTIADRKGFLAAFERLAEGLVAHAAAVAAVGESSRVGALAAIALRVAVTRGDNGAPDWAGTTDAYKTAFGTYLNAYAREHSLTDAQVDKYRSAVRSYASDHQLLDRAKAEHRARTDSKAGITPEQVAEAFSVEKPLPSKVKQAIRKENATQVSKDGKRLRYFTDADVATTGGRKPKRAPATGGGASDGNASETTPGKQWASLRAEVKDGKLALPVIAEELHHLATVIADAIVGREGKVPAAKPGRKDAVDTLAQVAALLDGIGHVINAKQEREKAVAPYRWTEASEK